MTTRDPIASAEQAARAILEAQARARVDAVRTLAAANQDERAAEAALEQARKAVAVAKADAVRAGWSEKELRDMELIPGARKRRARRAPEASTVPAASGANGASANGAPAG